MQVFNKTGMPSKEGDEFMECGREDIDALAYHYYLGDKVSQAELQAERKLIKYDLLTRKLPQTVKDGKLSGAE